LKVRFFSVYYATALFWSFSFNIFYPFGLWS
jgi:hypothetical protein